MSDERERLHALGNEVQVLRGELSEAQAVAQAANMRTLHLEALVADFVDEIRSSATKLRRLHTVMRDAVELARQAHDPASHRKFSEALKEIDDLRRDLSSAADRFLTDTQPMWNPSPGKHDEG